MANAFNQTQPKTVSPNVDYSLPAYDDMLPLWTLVEDCVAGEMAMKEKGLQYLPSPVPLVGENNTAENIARYEDYLKRAVFYAVTKRTLEGLVGTVYRRDPVFSYPEGQPVLEQIYKNVDGEGATIDQQSKKVLSDVLQFGRSLLFVDYPTRTTVDAEGNQVSLPTTRKDQEEGGVRPVIIAYSPLQVRNWRTKQVGAETRVSLVVLKEQTFKEEGDDEFEPTIITRWRELRLDENNKYRVRIWEANKEGTDPTITQEFYPTDATGNTFDRIPVAFVGSANNDTALDNPPLVDIATLNVAHYRNSADHEESVFMVGQPTPYASMTDVWWEDVLEKKPIQMGSRAFLYLPQEGQAGLLQADPNTMVKEAMEQKEQQMIKLGAKLIEPQAGTRTATEAKMQEASELSVLSSAAQNVSAAYTSCIEYICRFINQPFDDTKIFFELNNDFETHNLSSQQIAQIVELWVKQAITDNELRDKLTKAGLAFESIEDWETWKEEAMLNQAMQVGLMSQAESPEQGEGEDDDDADADKPDTE